KIDISSTIWVHKSKTAHEKMLRSLESIPYLRSLSRCATLLLIVHLLLGFRRLREVDYYRDHPRVLRLMGLRKLPDASAESLIPFFVQDYVEPGSTTITDG
ncbi:MAG: hypothetical protein V3W19_12420, partial [Desulfatiglandales bacterium]